MSDIRTGQVKWFKTSPLSKATPVKMQEVPSALLFFCPRFPLPDRQTSWRAYRPRLLAMYGRNQPLHIRFMGVG